MRFHATNKLLTVYKRSLKQNQLDAPNIGEVEALPADRDELYDWHVSLIEVEDQFLVAFVNDLTQFPIITGPFSTVELANAFETFNKLLSSVMKAQQFNDEQITEYLNTVQPIELTKSVSRKKLGPLTAVVTDTNYRVKEEGLSTLSAEEYTDFLGGVPRVKDDEVFIPVEKWYDTWMERTETKGFSAFTTEEDDKWIPAHGEPDNQEWTNLYDAIERVKQVAPWKQLDDSQWIAVTNPTTGEQTFVSIMGQEDVFKGLGLYTGDEGLRSLYKIIDHEETVPAYNYHTVQDGIVISFIEDSERVDQDNMDRLNRMNLFDSKETMIPEILKYTPGFIPWAVLNEAEVEWTTTVLNQLLTVIESKENPSIPAASSGKVINRIEKDGKWMTETVDLPTSLAVQKVNEPIQFRNDLARYQIKRAPKVKNTIVLDVAHTQAVMQDHPHERPYYPIIMLCAEKGSGKVLNFKTLQDQTHVAQQVFNMLIEVCAKGKPKEIVVRKASIEWIVEDFCKKNNIKFKTAKRLPEIEAVMKDLNEEMQ
ncbi:DUF7309 domain-containing protein [Marinilactibacillus kalidii]|uniref:DUF7309 domain-containing protein n=1 Tax=Marinilactibacillus kalidii TaxID=2820274 RepID=UPI001ABE512C|nr:hypothetical protein [Marinilactibacillus kalidii]